MYPFNKGAPQDLILDPLLCLLFLILAQVVLDQSLQGVLPPGHPARDPTACWISPQGQGRLKHHATK